MSEEEREVAKELKKQSDGDDDELCSVIFTMDGFDSESRVPIEA